MMLTLKIYAYVRVTAVKSQNAKKDETQTVILYGSIGHMCALAHNIICVFS